MTQRKTIQTIRDMGMSCTHNGDEYKVNYRNAGHGWKGEQSAYFTPCPFDAIATAIDMRRRQQYGDYCDASR